MENKTLKQLQTLCKDAGLQTTGKKKILIERLQQRNGQNSVQNDLLERIQGLEETIAQLTTTRSSASSDVGEDDTVIPHSVSFAPNIISSPCTNMISTASAVNNVPGYGNLPIPNRTLGQPQVPVSNVQQYMPSTVYQGVQSVSASHYVGVPQHGASVPQYSGIYPQWVGMSQTANDPQRVSIPQAMQAPIGYAASPVHNAAPQVSAVQAHNVPYAPAMNMHEILALLPEYDPANENSLSSKQFVQRIQMLMGAYRWRDDIVIFAAQQKLKGHAKLWADAQPEIFLTWKQFSDNIVNAFPFDENAASAHIKMNDTKREFNETPQNYYFRMIAMGARFGLPDNETARHIIKGINDIELKRKISNDYVSCADLLRDINSYCRFNEVRTVNTKPKEYVRPFAGKNVPTTGSQPQNNLVTSKHVKCYNCGKYGHIAANCRAPKRSTGNLVAGGPANVEKRGVADNKVNVVQSKNVALPEIVKKIKINNTMLEALIDPGSSHSLIRASCADNLINVTSCEIPLVGFGGGQFVCTKAATVNLEIDDQLMRTQILLVDDELIQYDALIGRNVICQNGKRTIIENDSCWIEEVENLSSCAKELKHADYQGLKNIINNFKGCFATKIEDLGRCTIKKMSIKLNSENPVNMKPYRIAFALRPKVKEMIDELLQAKIIRRSTSPYASPVVVVPKKTGELRLCIDYRQLNKITIREPYPIPVIDEQLAYLAGNKYFTLMDLKMGYHQIEIEEDSKKYTGFVTMGDHFEYERMPFGLVNAPAVFQSIMNVIVNQMEPGEVLAYLDDIVIPSKTVESGLQRLHKFLKLLSEAKLTLRLDKCYFLATQIAYLGHEVNADGIKPGERKISAVKNFPTPKNAAEVRRFLGLTGFFRKFVRDYALISRPLTSLLKKSEAEKFRWGVQQEEAFRKLIEILCNNPLLALYETNAYHEVHTDASSVGLAGVLLQSQDKAGWQPVAYFSRQCTDAESRYHAYELEILAVVETLTRFRIYLLGKPFTLVTDCSAIAKAKANTQLIPKISRWYMRILEFDCEMVHRAGTRLAHVDALSRAPTEPPCEVETAGFVMNLTVGDQDWILTMQLQDKKLKEIISVLNGEKFSEQETQLSTDYKLQHGRLYRKCNGLKLVVPKNVCWRIVKLCHDDAGHFALEKTMERIQQKFWFPRIRKYVREYISACIQCCYNKACGGKTEAQLHFPEIEPIPFTTIHIDHLGPFVRSSKGMLYVLVMVDSFSKYVVIKAVRSTKTLPVISALTELTSYFGLPKRIVTDRGTAYTSRVFEQYCEQHSIQHVKTAVRSPRANGQAERTNQLILNFLRTSTKESRHWDQHIHELQWTINTQKNATSGFTPNQLVFDFSLRDIVHNQLLAAVHDENESVLPIIERREVALQRMQKERNRWKQRFDGQHKQPRQYNVDDLVVVEYEPVSTGVSRKLEPKFRGPYVIAKVLPNDRYVVTDVPGMTITQRRLNSVFAVDKLKPWCSDSPELVPNDDGDEDQDTDDDFDGSLEDDARSGVAELSTDK